MTDKLESISIKRLSYRYKNSNSYALKNINLEIPRGEKLGVVGLNGAGKSTLVKCISGLYKDYEGSIKVNEYELLKDKIDLSNNLGVLYQASDIYPFTIGENIASSETINQKKANTALDKMDLTYILDKGDEGLNTYIGKVFSDQGIDLSGGEVQKLNFSRIIYKDPDIVILDEPTANLDIDSEQRLVKLIKDSLQDKTIIFVSHRLNSIKDLDRIVVLNEGQLVEVGSYDDLMNLKGIFYRLYKDKG